MRMLATSAALAAVLAAGATAPAAAQNLVYGSWVPATDWLNAGALPETFRRIAEETGGAVTWELVPGGQLAGGVETFAAVKDGLMDGGVAVPTYVPDLTPAMSMLCSTVVPGSDPVAAAGASVETIMLNCPSCLAEARAQNALPLGGYAGAPFYLMCREPVTSVADIAGKRVRASGASLGILNQAGAQVISASLTEAVTLLQRGGLDCVAGVSGWLRTFGYGEFAKHVTDFPLGVSSPVLAMWINRDVFKAMTREQQIAHLRGAAYVGATQTIDLFIRQNAANVETAVAQFGVQFHPVGDDCAALMAACQAEERGIHVGKAESFGVADAAAIYDAYAANLVKWRALSAEIGDDVEKFAQVPWDEVCSKVNPDDLQDRQGRRAVRHLDGALERLERLLPWVAVLAGAAMMLHVAVDVFGRTVLNRPLSSTNTVAARYYMVALAFLPLAFVSRTMGQIPVDVFTSCLRGWAQRAVEAFALLLTLACLGRVTWQAWVSAARRTASGEFVDLQVMLVPTWPARWIVPLACGVLFLHVAIRLLRTLLPPELGARA